MSAAKLPPAPALFSTAIGWPNIVCIWAATMRVKASTPPPAAVETMTRIGWLGKFAAPCARRTVGVRTRPTVDAIAERLEMARSDIGWDSQMAAYLPQL